MKNNSMGFCFFLFFAAGVMAADPNEPGGGAPMVDPLFGRIEVSTVPFDTRLKLLSATYTPSGKVLVAWRKGDTSDRRDINLAVMDDDGSNLRTFFSGKIPPREKDNGLRFMVFPDNKRIFMGDFVVECMPDIDACDRPNLIPVEYPKEVAGGDHVMFRWSEIIVAPDNEHVAWTTLFANFSAAVFTGKLEREGATYKIASPRMVSTYNAFRPDPQNPGGVIPNPFRGGEVKQFVHGGTAISMVGAKSSDVADSVVQHLDNGEIEEITHTPGYDETTMFSPDEKLGIVMSTRFSRPTDMAILGLMPRPYPASLNMALNSLVYTYSVTGVRQSRPGNIGPVLVGIDASKSRADYRGVNLGTETDWIYASPISWHPGGKKGMWQEVLRDGSGRSDRQKRIRVVHLPDYQPGAPVAAQATPDQIPYAAADLSAVEDFLDRARDIDVKVYGRHSGYIEYRRSAAGGIDKKYVDFSDDGESVYSGEEQMQENPRGYSTYQARVKLAGPKPGTMDLRITFGPLRDELPARLVFSGDGAGKPLTHGYTEYAGQRLDIESLVP